MKNSKYWREKSRSNKRKNALRHSRLAFLGKLVRSDRNRTFVRWGLYSFILLFLYTVMAGVSGGFFGSWQPLLIIPLAVAVAMHESELNSAIFAALCGLVIDIACGRLFGFSGVWLMPGCVGAALLVSHLIKANLLNFFWVNAVVCALMAFADYFFRYVLWNVNNAHFILWEYILPVHLSAVAFSPLLFLAVRKISHSLSPYERYNPIDDNNSEVR